MTHDDIPETTVGALAERYAALLLDAYGVLVHQHGPLDGGPELIERLNAAGKPYWIVSNDASRLIATTAARYRAMGLRIPEGRILNSGALLGPYFRKAGLEGARCAVLGPDDSVALVREAGGEVVPPSAEGAFDVLVVCDEEGFPLRETLDAVLTALVAKAARGEPAHLVLPNPDLIYPSGPAAYGFTAGAIALLLEQALERVFGPREALRFSRLGKPHPPLLEEAIARAGSRDVVMIGDQLETDIAAAERVGIASALVQTGLSVARDRDGLLREIRPTYRLRSLRW